MPVEVENYLLSHADVKATVYAKLLVKLSVRLSLDACRWMCHFLTATITIGKSQWHHIDADITR